MASFVFVVVSCTVVAKSRKVGSVKGGGFQKDVQSEPIRGSSYGAGEDL